MTVKTLTEEQQYAVWTFDRMTEIVKGEMIMRSAYSSSERFEGGPALCEGRKYCAIGSLVLAAGYHPDTQEFRDYTYQKTRDILSNSCFAYTLKIIDEAAEEWAELQGITIRPRSERYFTSSLEQLFENHVDIESVRASLNGWGKSNSSTNEGRAMLLEVIAAARVKVLAG
jgi:hypothetical protein